MTGPALLAKTTELPNEVLGVSYSWQTADSHPGALAWLVCNAYGVLPYVHSIASCLTKSQVEVYAENARGQGGRCGELTMPNAASDLVTSYRRVVKKAELLRVPIVGIIHCSGAFALASALRSGNTFEHLDALIIYSYLHHPKRLWPRTKKKLDRLGVRYDPKLAEKLPSQNIISTIPCPKHVIHPTTIRNLARASTIEAEIFSTHIGASSLHYPSDGYTFDTEPQVPQAEFITKNYFLPVFDFLTP